jgi:chaperonin cofactor prefoldin
MLDEMKKRVEQLEKSIKEMEDKQSKTQRK